MSLTVHEILRRSDDAAPAVLAPGCQPLTYAGLRAQVEGAVAALNAAGIGRNGRVALVLPNGPTLATAFLAVAAGAAAAPLNPAYRAEELEFYLTDLAGKALIVEAGSDTAARAVAARLGVAVVELTSRPEGPAGLFDMATSGPTTTTAAASTGLAEADDVALVLHTSGTTSRPKMVPLSHANICASARSIGATLALGPADRCLNIMPLFHIHGLMAAVLASLAAGGSVFCTPGFNALRMAAWLEEARPTWYTAVPTMHQAILGRIERTPDLARGAGLRFIRSSSASLAPQLMHRLEAVFDAPVIESYGMTEAAHQMASNPLPPRPRKAGSVGPAAGPEIAIMGEDGRLLPQGAAGEVVIRGASVTRGYESNAKANAEAFRDGWFRTGDLGRLDEDGYLSIIGRLKEIINRGGEKVSPREVDEVLLNFPAVEQAVTFALPHASLGEEVAAAIVLRPAASASEREIRTFVALHLADFKVPRRIVFVEQIPVGPSGKLQRIGLAARLGLTS